MPTSRRTLDLLRGGLVWAAFASFVYAEVRVETTVLADDLSGPTAVAAHAAADGGVRVLVFESEAARLTEFNLLGERVFGRETVTLPRDWDVAGVVIVGQRRVLLGPRGLVVLPSENAENASPASMTGPPVLGPPALGGGWLFAQGEKRLLRARLAQGRLTSLRPVNDTGRTPLAVAFSPEGYLLTLSSDDSGDHRLAFYDPNLPETAAATYSITGLTDPIAVAYARGNRLLVLCGTSREASGGLYRIEIGFRGNRPVATAKLVTELQEPMGMAALPDGDLAVTLAGEGTGSLLRLTLID